MQKLCKNGENGSRGTLLRGRDGLEICREIRGFNQVPLIIVTTGVEEIDHRLGPELGADNFICKPYSPRKIIARVKVVLWRTVTISVSSAEPLTLDKGPPVGPHQ